jgi:hypothetical protein
MNTSKQLFAEAQATHSGDRAALLAAINQAAGNMGAKKGAASTTASQRGAVMMRNA